MISGSESVRKTQAIGDRLQEANNINKGLLALGNCVSDICGNKTHIPFRNSTLTKVLRECLHGEGQTIMISCISPTEPDLSETMNTLRYANRAKNMQKPPIPKHLLQFSSAKKRKFATLTIPPTPAKFMKMNNTITGAITPFKSHSKSVHITPKMNATVASCTPSMKKIPSFSESLENISESDETLSEISSIYPPSAVSSVTSTVTKAVSDMGHNMTLLDATVLSPMIRRVLKEQQDQFMQRLEQTLLLQKTKTPNKSSPKLARRSPRLSLQQKQNGASPKLREDDLLGADETLISGPAFSESRQKMGESKASSNLQSDEICDDLISSRPFSALKDVTNADKHRRKSAHKEAVEKTASPSFSTKSLMGKENDEVERMAKEMGINSPLLMFGDEDDNIPRTARKCSTAKRSVRRTTMLPPELSKTLNESFNQNKDRRRSSRLEVLQKFKNPLDVKANWQVFDQDKHNGNILSMVNSANLQMLQKIPAIGPKTAFLIHSHRELHGKFANLQKLQEIPGVQKSFFNKFVKTHQVVL